MLKNKLFSDMNKHNIIITTSKIPKKQFLQSVSSLDSVTLLKIDFNVTPKFHSKNSAPIFSSKVRLQTLLQDSTSRLHSILYTMPTCFISEASVRNILFNGIKSRFPNKPINHFLLQRVHYLSTNTAYFVHVISNCFS